MTTLPIRTLLKTDDGRVMRIIDNLPRSNTLVIIDADDKKAWPAIRDSEEIHALVKERKWVVVEPKKSSKLSTGAESAHAAKLHADRWITVQKLLWNPELYQRQTRNKALALFAAATGKSQVHLRELARLAWQGGMTFDSVRTDWGGRGSYDGKARGRKPHIVHYEPYVWPIKLRQKVARFATSKYLRNSLATYESVYDLVVDKFFCFADKDGELTLLPPGQLPSYRQIRSILDAIPLEDKLKYRRGQASYNNNYKPLIGSVSDDCFGPGHTFEIDATQVDHWVLSRESGKVRHVIGKATLYLIVDRFSRLIAGWAVSLDPPSWTGAMQAILSIFQDKKDMCEKNGAKYNVADWPAHALMPARFFADRGSEMTGHNSNLIIEGLGIPVTNARSLWSAAKGMVECTLKLVNISLKAMNAGYDPAYNTNIRRSTKFFRNAKLTLPKLRAKLLQAIIYHNTRVHKSYQLRPEDVRDGVQAIPALVFTRGLAEYGRPSTFTEDEVRFHLMPAATAVVHREGIWYGGAMYVCDQDANDGLQKRAANDQSFEVDIRHVPGLVDDIYVIDPRNTKVYYRASLKASEGAKRGMSRYELLDLEAVQKENNFWSDRHNVGLRVKRLKQQRDEGLTKLTPPAKKTKNIKQERAADSRVDRSENLSLPIPPGTTPPPDPELAQAAVPAQAISTAQTPARPTVIPFLPRTVIGAPPVQVNEQTDISLEATSPPPQTPTPDVAPSTTSLAAVARARLLQKLKGQ